MYSSLGALSFLLDPAGQIIGGRWSGGGNSGIRLGSRMLAQYQSNGAEFTHVNVLGSETQNTDYAGNGGQGILFYPWGQVWQNPSGAYPNSFYQIFASLQLYDTSTDGYVPPFRYYVPEQGRWLTPDPLAGDVTNPQSLNRYAYALNNPTSLTDPLGLDPCDRNPDSRACNHDPHFNDAVGSVGDSSSCYVDGIQTNCGVAYAILNAGTGDTTVRSAGGFLNFQVPIPPGEVQTNFIDPLTGESFGGGSTDYPASFYTVSIPTGDASSSWWGTFARSFVQNFSLSSARRPGESFSACVSRAQNGLLGGAGSNALNAVVPISLASSVLTTSPGTVRHLVKLGFNEYSWRDVPLRSVAEAAAGEAVQAGTISSETAAFVSVASAAVSKIAVPVTAAALATLTRS